MIKRLLAAVALSCLCVSAFAIQTVKPLTQPHWTFVDGSGAPCAGCYMYTYAAGTTTPLATYTDSTGTVVNTNPIVLDAAGGANIWVGAQNLKLVLKDALMSTIWTVDNIPSGGGGGSPCGPATTIQIANSTLTGFSCDAFITINTTAHTINVGGPLPATHFTLTNLAPVASAWTWDVTSPVTAAKTIGGGTPAAGKYIDGGTGNWTALPSPGPGTVTSVDATVPTQMTISGNPITVAGALNFGLHTTGSETDVVTAPAAGTSGHCAQWNASGGIGDAGAACALGTSVLAASGYQTFGSGLIMQWTAGVSQSDSTVTQNISFPIACPTQVFIVIPSSYESIYDDTQMPVFVVISNTLSQATVAMQRVPDHGYNAATPRIEVLCK